MTQVNDKVEIRKKVRVKFRETEFEGKYDLTRCLN